MGARKTLKNVSLLCIPRNGRDTYKLLCDEGEIESYSTFIASLRRNYQKSNTFRTYARAIALFYDFLLEATYHVTSNGGVGELTKYQLIEIIDSWKDYLVAGVHSGNALASAVAHTLPRAPVKAQTSNIYHNALRLFLRVSEQIRKEHIELQRVGLKVGVFDTQVLHTELTLLLKLSHFQRVRMLQGSMIPGVLPPSAAVRATGILPAIDHSPDEFDHSKVFPLDLFGKFVDNLRTFRDKSLYCFYAASGCRGSEALQLLWEDIDIKRQKVLLVDPYSRINHKSYLSLSQRDLDKLSWKGRATQDTFLIEPFASMFWKHLKAYLETEYLPHGRHSFIFQVLEPSKRGTPYFTSAPSSRQEIFLRAKKATGLPASVDGAHCLRHAYGTYLLNYIPLANGTFGMPLEAVKSLLGHNSLKSTKKYAKNDKDLVSAHLEYANHQMLQAGESNISLNKIKIDALLAQAKALGWDAQQGISHD
jgi:integrase